MTKQIPLTPLSCGLVAIVDDEDYEWLTRWTWRATLRNKSKGFIASRNTALRGSHKSRAQRTIAMHRAIMEAEAGIEVDHIDRDPLNNTRANLRTATRRQNAANQKKRGIKGGASSQYKGVTRKKDNKRNPWSAQIKVNYKYIHIGVFATEVDAARAYDEAAQEHFGAYACLNFPEVLR